MFAKLAVTAALCGAIVMGGTEAKKKGPTITNKVFFDVEIGEVPRSLLSLPPAGHFCGCSSRLRGTQRLPGRMVFFSSWRSRAGRSNSG